ncbi:site-specific DNA-methyltransferase [Streptococcus suis]|nr:site-specific DNA-methyltransferase [Streptococcus suis]NQJ53047.1 site-specific DNA-methyltransferase [Streptococcus suis]NQJ57450.1 site-specific DNA-methyltransferase [Streptococcus suis]
MSTAKLGEYTQVEKLDLTSKDILSDNIAKIGQLFPEVLTESSDENGRLRPAIDFDKLRQFLSREIVEGREFYEFTWVGKRGAIAESGKPTTQTLRPDLEESVDFDKSENIFITGDNLEVLKVLQESYLGKIDMIYIDPPYNTGQDFVYRDRSQLSEKELEELSKQRNENDELLFKFEKNAKQSAKYHSDWLNMMYPRLVLARNLLKDSGVIFISIDDNEQANLKAICDEIFGEENFVANICHKSRASISNDKIISGSHNIILLYAKNERIVFSNRSNIGTAPILEGFTKEDELGKYKLVPVDGPGGAKKGNPYYEFLGIEKYWRFSKNTMEDMYNKGLIVKTGNNLQQKYYLDKAKNTRKTVNSWWDEGFYTSSATSKLNKLMGQNLFDTPKPIELIRKMLEMFTFNIEFPIVLDFFAGSATTAHAVMQLNAEDGGNRKYILCTLDEQVADKSAAKEAGYETIDQISRERIRRAAKKIQEEHPETVGKQDFGFRAYKLDSSNFKDVSQTPDSFSQESLFDSVSNIKDGRTDLDLLFQIMLTWGMELSLPIAKTQIDGTDIYNVADGALIACFADEISESVLRQIAKEEPLRAVFKDESFANSAAKINLGQIFKEEAPNTKVKVV